MKSLKESLFDKDVTKNSSFKYQPKNRKELQECIVKEIKLQGPDADLNCIDVSKITSMVELFSGLRGKVTIGNIDISLWNVSKVKNMNFMFAGCWGFNSDISKWDVSNVEYMCYMFYECSSFDCDLSKWDVSKVKKTDAMFHSCVSLKKIPNWYMKSLKESLFDVIP